MARRSFEEWHQFLKGRDGSASLKSYRMHWQASIEYRGTVSRPHDSKLSLGASGNVEQWIELRQTWGGWSFEDFLAFLRPQVGYDRVDGAGGLGEVGG